MAYKLKTYIFKDRKTGKLFKIKGRNVDDAINRQVNKEIREEMRGKK